jgi:ribosomal protein S18 acetylase RimI-like enzyme
MKNIKSMIIRPVGFIDWPKIRDVHIRMLQDSPGAFVETLDDILGRTKQDWKDFAFEHAESLIKAAFLAFDDDGLCGFVICDLDDPRILQGAGLIRSLWVAASNRRTGLGYSLMQIAINWIQEKGVLLVTLGVTSTNMQVMSFYKKLGFENLGMTIGVQGQPEKSITVMGKRL